MKVVKIVMFDGEIVIIRNCCDYYWRNETKFLVVCKNNGHHILFNGEFVQYIGYLEDLEEGESDE